MSYELSKYILTTVAYYDVMDYPMTAFEIWRHLTTHKSRSAIQNLHQFSLAEVLSDLEGENLKKVIEKWRGFYFLRGRQKLVSVRSKRNKISEEKYKILRKVTKILRFVPFVRMVAATGSLAMKNAEKSSDLDLLIVLESGKIFTGRTLVTLAVQFLGKRRHSEKITDRACLNYFITTSSLEIGLKDLFSSSEYSFVQPLFGFEIFKKFQKENGWIKKYKITFQSDKVANLKLLDDTLVAKMVRNSGEKILSFNFIENGLKKWQIKRIQRDPRTHQAGSMVLVSDDALVFLPTPQGPQIYDQFEAKLATLT